MPIGTFTHDRRGTLMDAVDDDGVLKLLTRLTRRIGELRDYLRLSDMGSAYTAQEGLRGRVGDTAHRPFWCCRGWRGARWSMH